ncbi:MAG TPA: glycosyltransferase family 2 protein [Egibacteraceae bacterium]|nr:glycosyltransferase family 2 protein [Egibacteraceae bacterium]
MGKPRREEASGAAAVEDAGVTLSVVIPVYNEEAILAETVAAVVQALRQDDNVPSFEVIVSENGSSDGTRAVARELADRYGEVVVLESDVADYGAAMREGFRAASGAFIVNFDADYYDMEFVRRALVADGDIVIAAKGITGSDDTRTLVRRVASRVFGFLVRGLLSLQVSETHGMKVFRRGAVEPLIPDVQATKDLFDTELVALAEKRGLEIVELPIRTAEMRHSRSAMLTRVPRTVWGLVMMRRRLRASQRLGPPDEPDEDERRERRCEASGMLSDDVLPGRRLFVLRHGAVAVTGSEDSFVALDEAGVTVVAVLLDRASVGTGSEIADELDRLAQLSPAQLVGTARPSSSAESTVADGHAAFFDLAGTKRPALNRRLEAVVLLRTPPDPATWEELIVELGGQLAGVYRLDGDGTVPLEVPDELRSRDRPGWLKPATRVAGVVMLLAGIAVLAVVVRDQVDRTADAPPTQTAVRDVAMGVPAAATHNQWIGQDRVLRTSDGRLLAVYGTDQGLSVVEDHRNYGRAWHEPEVLPGIPAVSTSAALDDADRLHVAFSDGSGVHYAVVEEHDGQWTPNASVELDAATQTPYVDIAYDEAADLAHVVWVEEAPTGQSPRWAAVGEADGSMQVVAADRLAPRGTDMPVLVNVAAGPGSPVVATYRRGDAPIGWFARGLPAAGDGTLTWGQEERVPTEAGIGAAAVALDAGGTAHLVLRDSTSFALTYFTRSPAGQWSGGETAVDAETIEEIDFPSLTVDRSSRVVYLFFQTDRVRPAPGVQIAVRDPVHGWQPPLTAASPAAIPHGAAFPTALSTTAGAPVVLWTSGGASPVVQAAVVAP